MTSRSLRTPDDLINAGLVKEIDIQAIEQVAARYSVAIPAYIANLIATASPADVIARQYIPTIQELKALPGESADPIGDIRHSPVPGIVHRYKDRVLLKIVHICPVYCRFCFRREMVGPGHEPNLTPGQVAAALAYVQAHDEIAEVIMTGGDPFILSPNRIADITSTISAIPHVKRIRWHTRVPVVEPAKINNKFAEALKSNTAQTIVAIHANHPREFTPEAIYAVSTLHRAGISLISQSVLLKGINDDAATLTDLIESFRANRIKPYYIHHADLAPGTSHFRTTIAHGQELMGKVQMALPAQARPTYVLDIPGGFSKVNLLSDDATQVSPGHWRLRDSNGQYHEYHEDPSLFG